MADPVENTQDPAFWVRKAKDDLARARNLAVQRLRAQEDAAMRSAGIASLLAARRTRDWQQELSELWQEALEYDSLADSYQQIDPLQADYYRERSIHQALLAALELE